MQISDSSIYYPDMFTGFGYHLKHDSLFVHREDGVVPSFIVRVTKDTLVLRSFDVDQVYTRTEPHRR